MNPCSAITPAPSPDDSAAGFLKAPPTALRYEHASVDPDDVGMKLARLITPNARVLDVGCGTGSLTELIRDQRAVTIVGVEPDEERAQRAAARGLTVHHGFLSDDVFSRHGPFDFIVFADVLEHLPNPAEIVCLAKRGLKPGGSLVVSVPNVAHWFVRLDLLMGRFTYQDCGIMDATHLRWFTRETIREFFEHLGFAITAMDYTVNIDLPEYGQRAPWRWMRLGIRRRLVRGLASLRPGLFGCQHIVRATILDQA
jgi:methionine biosynthesis protein MetW